MVGISDANRQANGSALNEIRFKRLMSSAVVCPFSFASPGYAFTQNQDRDEIADIIRECLNIPE